MWKLVRNQLGDLVEAAIRKVEKLEAVSEVVYNVHAYCGSTKERVANNGAVHSFHGDRSHRIYKTWTER